jgi:hypothetical protein
MTYTFKLARRLAVSRIALPVILVVAACGDDTTAPNIGESPASGTWRPRDLPALVKVSPSTVTLETNQLIQFRAHGQTSAGDSVDAAVAWSTSGGAILPDGRFSAAAIGTYTVIGSTRVRGVEKVDTARVKVVRRQTKLVRIEISPTSATLSPGLSKTFTALGRLVDGTAVPIGVNWTASGGSIDAGGTYVAGDTAGTYRVSAINTAGTLADTVEVTITAPPAPPPPSPAPPAVEKVTLVPASATLASGSNRQFSAYGLTSAGDSVAITVSFTATGGTISANGLYTAGPTAGTYRVIATSSGLADTSAVTVTPTSGSATRGIPFGPTQLLAESGDPDMFTMSLDGVLPSGIVSRIGWARANKFRLLMNMTGGSHSLYMTDGVFDMGKWKARMNSYNTAAIKDAIAAGVADGTIVGNSVMDEPHVTGSGSEGGGNTWGPAGTMTKARVDSMCGYVKAIFPTLPTGVFHRHDVFEPTKDYAICEFIAVQYVAKAGDINSFRDAALAFGRRSGISIVFSLNILNGGTQDRDGTWDCIGTGGLGTRTNNCRMTAQQVRNWGSILGPAGCGLLMWKYDSTFMANPDNRSAFQYLADLLASTAGKPCTRI